MRSDAPVQVRQFHGMLILLPSGLLAVAVVLDLVDVATGTSAFAVAAYWILAGGVMAGLMAGSQALMAWLQLPARSRARRLGTLHGGCIAVILVLFVGSWLLRDAEGGVPQAALALSFLAASVSVLAPILCTARASRSATGGPGSPPMPGEPSSGSSARAH